MGGGDDVGAGDGGSRAGIHCLAELISLGFGPELKCQTSPLNSYR